MSKHKKQPTDEKNQTIAILGAGSWGTAMAIHLANEGYPILLWGHTPQHITQLSQERMNKKYLPDIPFPSSLQPRTDLNKTIKEADHVIIAVPSHAFAELIHQITVPLKRISWLTKGVNPETNELLSETTKQKFGNPIAMNVIAGPSFAKEVAKGLPTALTIAGTDKKLQLQLQKIIHHHKMRVYLSEDIIGVQICGAVKNVMAIACGISDGLGYGANAKAALITRGLAEMHRLGLAIGAQAETFTGLAGVGDLVLTCTDDQSRNRRFGLQVGKGISINEAEQRIGQVVEGKHNAKQVCALARKYHINMPICEQVGDLLLNKIDAKEAAYELIHRPTPGEEMS